MYISRINLHNFKSFIGDHEFTFDKGVNFLVGDNNCGKSSVLEAVDFLRTKRTREDIITKTATLDDFVSVEVEFSGDDIEALLDVDDLRKYKSAIIDTHGKKSLRVKRSSAEDIGKVYFYKPDIGCFSNLTGVDKTISALFDAQIVWADADSSDVSDFSKTKVCGKIINAITKNFVHTETWKQFQKSHQDTFGDGGNSLATTLKPIEEKISLLLSEQYGEAEVRFTFSLPEIDSFFKSGNIALSDNGIETRSADKGTGMQRALALALIQVYAEISSNSEDASIKPIMFFLDEPETFLHPRAQYKLLDALDKISERSQIFVVTHSPYLLKKYKNGSHSLHVLSKNGAFSTVAPGKSFSLFGSNSPTWGEINYYAFGVFIMSP